MGEHGRAIALDMLVEPDAGASLGQHARKRGLADLKRIAPHVVAVQLDKVEGVEEDAPVSAVVPMRSNEATPLSSQATASPSIMQERKRRRVRRPNVLYSIGSSTRSRTVDGMGRNWTTGLS